MRIEGSSSDLRDGVIITRANVIWEEARRPAREIFFEVSPSLEPAAGSSRSGEPDLHPFLLAVGPPAVHYGERRIAFDGTVSPRLERGLLTAMETLTRWYYPGRTVPRIEPRGGRRPDLPAPEALPAIALSGGLDSMALLRSDRLQLPRDHPRSLRIGVFVDGFDINAPGVEDQTEFADRAFATLERAVADEGLELLRVRTNLRVLKSDWLHEHFGAALGAVAHACRHRVSRMKVAGGVQWKNYTPHGSHPLLDRHYSSEGVEIEHGGANDSRVDKARMIAGWSPGHRNLRVCWRGIEVGGPLNCSRCHKCVLTMLELLAVGALEDCEAFAYRDVTPDMVGALRERIPGRIDFLGELIEPLKERGRWDLVEAIEKKIAGTTPRAFDRTRTSVDAGWRSARKRVRKRVRKWRRAAP